MATMTSAILVPPARCCSRYSPQSSRLLPRDAIWSVSSRDFALRRDVSARAWWSSKKKDQEQAEVTAATSETEVSKGSGRKNAGKNAVAAAPVVKEEVEEVEMSWVEEKTGELVQMTGNAIQAIPGPRVGQSSVPWLLVLPVAYFSVTFVIAVYRTVKKYSSPKAKKRRMIGKNAFLVTSLDKYFPQRREEFDSKVLKELERKCSFDSKEVLRKYIRYAMNERAFTPETVADLIHLRRITKLTDNEIADVLNETSRRVVNENGTVMMDLRGLTERGVKRKAAVRSLFSKLLYLSELDEFCSTSRDALKIKELFGVTDEDANSLRIETLTQLSDIDSLDKMVNPEDTAMDEGTPDSKAS
ncbi:hypothetical protein SELMODRAFT_437286 [Selaginella moellendorffii]|uniref:Armadillo-like repeats domain-containing protein n=1 Tax=Selaginella moellendorffii TaxID=88036 RepID=D8QPW2_SELML|nr:uncharacterized protein LOC9663130 [Selaginella moellendorffii]EFJ37689.1 hypothetical protein SELMODRAFT_437286 [Selaginella moellendorffii]|eukprot:XP_024523127.1 uncharacterized protein LOC9663130 [Selaginella moellendorffii]